MIDNERLTAVRADPSEEGADEDTWDILIRDSIGWACVATVHGERDRDMILNTLDSVDGYMRNDPAFRR